MFDVKLADSQQSVYTLGAMGEKIDKTIAGAEIVAGAVAGAVVGQAVVRLPWNDVIPTESEQEDAILECAQALDATENRAPAPDKCKNYAQQYPMIPGVGHDMPTAQIFLADHTMMTVTDRQLHHNVENAAAWTSASLAVVGVVSVLFVRWKNRR